MSFSDEQFRGEREGQERARNREMAWAVCAVAVPAEKVHKEKGMESVWEGGTGRVAKRRHSFFLVPKPF